MIRYSQVPGRHRTTRTGGLRITLSGISSGIALLAVAGAEAESHPSTKPQLDAAEVQQDAIRPAKVETQAPGSTVMSPKNERTFRYGRINAGIIAPSVLLVFGGASAILFWQAEVNDTGTGWSDDGGKIEFKSTLLNMAAVTCLVVGVVGSITFLSVGLAMVHRAREREEALRLKREDASRAHIRFFFVATNDFGGGGLAFDF